MCRVDGCTRPVKYRTLELCKSCYDRRRSQGSEYAPRVFTRGWTLAQKLEHYRAPGAGDCLTWTSRISAQGYAMLWVPGGFRAAHRLAFELEKGPIPVGFEIDHTCHNDDMTCPGGKGCMHRQCTLPDHLRAATRVENIRASRRFERQFTSS